MRLAVLAATVAATVAVLAGCSAAAEPRPATTAEPPSAAPPGRSLTVVTYNVRGDFEVPRRREPGEPRDYADVLAAQGADVAGLQEITRDEARDVVRELGWGDSCAGAPTCTHATVDFLSAEGTAIVSRHPFVRPAAQWLLTDAPRDHPRYLQRATIAPAGTPVNVYNTHLTNLGAGPRDAQAEDIARIVAADLRRTGVRAYVLLGDLNARPGERTVETLLRTATDACADHDCGETIPARDNRNQTRATPTVRVDHVLAGPGLTARRALVPDPGAPVPRRDGSPPAMRYWQVSDHLPVVARLTLPR